MARKKEKSETKIYVAVPDMTQDIDGSVIESSGILKFGRSDVPYFVLCPSVNGGLEESRKIIKIPGYIVGFGQGNIL